jgi:hypothetical protein
MKRIPLTQGKYAKVDDENYERLMWCAHKKGRGGADNVPMHRFILDAPVDMEVDHIDHDNIDANLRLCTHAENLANMRPQKGCSSSYKGVCWDKARGKWKAAVKCRGKTYNLGRFDSEDEAALIYNEAAVEFFGEFAYLNDV